MRDLRRHRRKRRRYHAAFYMPWIGPLLRPGRAVPPGGAETQIFLVARALASRGLRVCIVAIDTPDGLPERVEGVDVIRRPAYHGHARWTGKIHEALALWRSLAGVDPDVIVTRCAGATTGLVGVFARLRGRRFIYSSASVSDFSHSELETPRHDQWLYRLGIALASTIVVQTDEQVDLCRSAFGREPALIRSIAEPTGAPGNAASCLFEAASYFLWVGRMVWYKHPLAFVDLARALPDARFKLLGVTVPFSEVSTALAAEVRTAASGLANLELLEPRPRRDVLALMDSAVAVVNTSEFEGMSNVLLEGWGRGIPALTLFHDPDGIIVRTGLGAFASGSQDELVSAAKILWDGRSDRGDVAERCRRYIALRHSPDAVAAQWAAVIGPTAASRAVRSHPPRRPLRASSSRTAAR